MKQFNTIILFLLALSWQAHGQLKLVDLTDLKPGMEHHQNGKIPVFRSALQLADSPKVQTTGSADVYHPDNLLAVVDGQLVVFPKEQLAISNGFRPFRNLMNISNGFLQLKNRYGVGVWTDNSISNGFLYFRGFAALATLHKIQDSAVTLSLAEVDPTGPSTAVTSSDTSETYDCEDWGNCDDDEYDFELDWFLDELSRNYNPWDRIMVMVDGMLVEMSVGALSAHLRNGAFGLGGGDGRMPEFP